MSNYDKQNNGPNVDNRNDEIISLSALLEFEEYQVGIVDKEYNNNEAIDSKGSRSRVVDGFKIFIVIVDQNTVEDYREHQHNVDIVYDVRNRLYHRFHIENSYPILS